MYVTKTWELEVDPKSTGKTCKWTTPNSRHFFDMMRNFGLIWKIPLILKLWQVKYHKNTHFLLCPSNTMWSISLRNCITGLYFCYWRWSTMLHIFVTHSLYIRKRDFKKCSIKIRRIYHNLSIPSFLHSENFKQQVCCYRRNGITHNIVKNETRRQYWSSFRNFPTKNVLQQISVKVTYTLSHSDPSFEAI
jgi:hypothetical protein